MTKRIISIKFYTVRMPDGKLYATQGQSRAKVAARLGVNVADVTNGSDSRLPNFPEDVPVQLTRLRAHLAALAPLLAALKPGDDAEPRERQEWAALRDAVDRAVSCASNLQH